MKLQLSMDKYDTVVEMWGAARQGLSAAGQERVTLEHLQEQFGELEGELLQAVDLRAAWAAVDAGVRTPGAEREMLFRAVRALDEFVELFPSGRVDEECVRSGGKSDPARVAIAAEMVAANMEGPPRRLSTDVTRPGMRAPNVAG
jgi:hypothetical protein